MKEHDEILIDFLETFHERAVNQRDDDIATPHPFANSDLTSPWYYYDRLVRGYHWDFLEDMDSWASRPAKPIPAIAVESYTTLITDSKPTPIVRPREEGDQELAELVKAGVDYWWEKEYMPQKTALAVKASRTFGIGWLYLYHDPDKGECCKVVHPESVLVDSNTTVEDFDPSGIEYEYLTTVGALMERYPDHDFDDFTPGWRPHYNSADRVQWKRYADNEDPNKSTPVFELWYKDHSLEDFESDNLIKGKTVKGKKKTYPGGRKLVVAGGQVLEDVPNPYNHGQFPLTPIHAYPVPGRFYGIGDVQNLLNITVMRNRMTQFLFDQTVKSGGGWVLVGRRSGIDPTKISNAPLQILPCDDPIPFRVERPLPPSRHVFDFIGMLDMDADDAMGLHDISKGAYTPGNKTAQEIAVLSESDRTRVRMAARWLTWALERVGRQLVSNLSQWNDFKWWVRVGDSTEPVEFNGKMMKQKKDGKITKENIEFDLSFAESSTLPPSQQQSYERVAWLLGNGVITPEDVLKYKLVDIPHADEILADHTQAQQMPPAGAMPPGMEQGMPQQGMPPEVMAMMQQGMPPMAPPQGVPPEEMLAEEDMMPPGMADPMAVIQQVSEETGVPPDVLMQMLQSQGL